MRWGVRIDGIFVCGCFGMESLCEWGVGGCGLGARGWGGEGALGMLQPGDHGVFCEWTTASLPRAPSLDPAGHSLCVPGPVFFQQQNVPKPHHS